MAGRDEDGGTRADGAAFGADGPVAGITSATAERVFALLADDGIVTARARGLRPPEADARIGLRADFFLGPDEGLPVSALAERRGDPDGWSSHAPTAAGDGTSGRVLRLSKLSGAGGEVCWVLSTHDFSPAAALRAGLRPEVAAAGREPAGLALWDAQLRCTSVNDVLERLDGIPRADRLGRRMTQALSGPDAAALEALTGSVLGTGPPAITYRQRQGGETESVGDRFYAVALTRLDRSDGSDGSDATAPMVCSLSVEITHEQRTRDHLAILGEASRRVGTTRDVMTTAQEMAEFAVPLIADYIAVDLAESVQLGEPLALVRPEAAGIPVFRRAAAMSVHAGVPESPYERGAPVFVPLSSPFTQVLKHGRSFFHPVIDTSRDTWLGAQRAKIVRDMGVHSIMMVPVREPGATVLGIAVFIRNVNPVKFDEDDLQLAEELVAQTARQLENARRYTRQHATALALQRNLLPHHLDGGPALEIASHYLPADIEEGVGGDWFDVIARRGSRVALVVGDVVGHGIGAAAAMGRLRTAVRTLEATGLEPGELLCRLDEVVVGFAEDDLSDTAAVSTTTGATCLFLVYDPDTRRAVAASAGHPPPIVVDPDGAFAFPEIPVGAPIGAGIPAYDCADFEIPEGSLIALYTDGLVEGRDWTIETGMNRLAEALAQPGLGLGELCGAAFRAQPADGFSARAELQLVLPKDDATLLLARTRARPRGPGPAPPPRPGSGSGPRPGGD